MAKVCVVREANAQETTPGVVAGMPQTGTNLPIHMLSLPSTGTNENHGDVGISYVVIPYPTPYFAQRKIAVDDVACFQQTGPLRTLASL